MTWPTETIASAAGSGSPGRVSEPQVRTLAQPGTGQREHVGRGVGGDDLVPGGQQVPGQRPAATAELEDEPAADG